MSTIFDLIKPSAELQILGPDGVTELPVKIRVQGLNTPAVKQKALDSSIAMQSIGKQTDADQLKKAMIKVSKSAEEMAAAAIVGWDNDEYLGGAYTPKYAQELCARPEMEFLVVQIVNFVTTQKNFFQDVPAVADGLSGVDA